MLDRNVVPKSTLTVVVDVVVVVHDLQIKYSSVSTSTVLSELVLNMELPLEVM